MSTPADWYPDPDDHTQLRYFDGNAWTDHRAPVSAPAPVAAITSPDAEPPTKGRGLAVAAVALLIVVVVAGYFLFGRGGSNAELGPLAPTGTFEAQALWQVDTGLDAETRFFASSPDVIVVAGRCQSCDAWQAVGLERDTGDILWKHVFEGQGARSYFEFAHGYVDGDHLIVLDSVDPDVGDSPLELIALDINTGGEVWRSGVEVRHWIDWVAATDQVAVVLTDARRPGVSGVDPQSGEVLFEHRASNATRSRPVALAGDRVVIVDAEVESFDDGVFKATLFAYDLDGRELWSADTTTTTFALNRDFGTEPANAVAIATGEGLAGFNIETGEREWLARHDTRNFDVESQGFIVDRSRDRVIACNQDDDDWFMLVARRLSDGEELWSERVERDDNLAPATRMPAVLGVLPETGDVLFADAASTCRGPANFSGIGIKGIRDSVRLTLVDGETGAQRWSEEIRETLSVEPRVGARGFPPVRPAPVGPITISVGLSATGSDLLDPSTGLLLVDAPTRQIPLQLGDSVGFLGIGESGERELTSDDTGNRVVVGVGATVIDFHDGVVFTLTRDTGEIRAID